MNESPADKGEGGGGPASRQDGRLREAALLEMGKALRAISIYPAQHPQRTNLLGQAFGSLSTTLQTLGDLSCRVTRGGFIFGDVKVGEKQALIAELANEMHLRQIKSFSLRQELAAEDFAGFLEMILEKPESFRRGHFIEKWFAARKIQTVWINEMDFSKITTTMAAAAEDEDEEGSAPSLAAQLEDLLGEIAEENDPERLTQLLRQLEVMAQPLREAKEFAALWWIVLSLEERIGPEDVEAAALQAVRALLVSAVRSHVRDDFLLHLLERFNRGHKDQQALRQVFFHVGPPVLDALMGVVSRTESITVYRRLLMLAVEFGPAARPVLETFLADKDPLKVRRALLLLSDLRSRESVEAIRRLIAHKDDKIRREAIRALAQIRGIEASRALIGALASERDPEIRSVVVTALGESKDLAAVPSLLKLIKGTPLGEQTTPLVETAVEALGQIGSAEALPELIKTLNMFSMFKRKEALRVRVKAAYALGRLGGESAMQALARYARGKDGPLDRACSTVLKALLANNGKPVDIAEGMEE